jgi:pilus assembly protein Flp/PilA
MHRDLHISGDVRLLKVFRLLDKNVIAQHEQPREQDQRAPRGDFALGNVRSSPSDALTLGGRSEVVVNQARVRREDMKNLVLRFIKETEGQDLIEYALLAALVALGAVAGMQALAGGINAKFSDVSSSLNSAS